MAESSIQGLEDVVHYPTNIRAAQIAEKRKKFDKLPSFVQAGLFLYEKLNNVRRQDFFPRLVAFDILKNEGNSLFAEGRYEEAARKYEEALCIFRYIRSEAAHWREEGIDDQYLSEVESKGQTEDEQSKINSFKLLCYLNLAACNLKLGNSRTAVDSCNEALRLDPTNVKALYRRAKAEMLVSKPGDAGYQRAVDDLDKAQKLDSGNESVKKEYREAVETLKGLEETAKKQAKAAQSAEASSMSPVPTMTAEDEKRLMEQVPELAALNEYYCLRINRGLEHWRRGRTRSRCWSRWASSTWCRSTRRTSTKYATSRSVSSSLSTWT